ncbi:hypothetical protein TrST_g4267 [Triparma strigata]|uniref:Transmembrane 9 superfamily member n=1 Tax=Triparma strigata TaxID=1606541 RepID=A0A9W7BNC0_9STRA|nr:hypothetical protein TrST_g4267 [Triparma strigata]
MRILAAALALAYLATVVSERTYVPGYAPSSYEPLEEINAYADLVESSKTQVPFSYYDMGYCKPSEKFLKKRLTSNLGSKLQGGGSTLLHYTFEAKHIEACQKLCLKTLSKGEVAKFRHAIAKEYRIHWQIDSLPLVMRSEELDYVIRGFPLGFVAPSSLTGELNDEYFLYNHLRITVLYHPDPSLFSGLRIVGFEVVPFSVNHRWQGDENDVENLQLDTCTTINPAVNDPSNFMKLSKEGDVPVLYTYDIDWKSSPTLWSNRWDIYLRGNPDDEIHVFAIVNSLMIIFFLSGIVAMILLRTLRKEISEYNELSTLEEAQEESGWKLVHADVFRPPRTLPMALSILVGTGSQIGMALVLMLLLACMGFLTPTDKGNTLTMVILLYVFSGSVAGYWSARLYKLFGGKDWKTNTIATAACFPSCIVGLFIILNIGLSSKGAATAVSFTTILAVFLLWLGVSTPLMFVGSYFGFRKETISVPLKTNQIARIIPEQGFYTTPFFSIVVGGILPFGSVCIELFFIMSSLWLSQIYYVFGFLFVVVLILVITCAEMSIVMTYFQLTNEDYLWWWRSFLSCASSGCYLFLYSIWYYQTKLELEGFLSGLVYFTYNAIIATAFGAFTGAIGFFSSLIFVREIYGALKVD